MTPAAGASFGDHFPNSVISDHADQRTALHRQIATLVSRLRAELRVEGELSSNEALAVRARMTPLDAQGRPRDTREVRLRILNDKGLAFEHPAPLADRRALMTVELPEFGAMAAEIELSWCRYHEGGRYTSGGRFVQLIDPRD